MATNLRVNGHFEKGGKTQTHFGSGIQFDVSIAMVTVPDSGGTTALRPDPSQINTVLSNNGKVPSGCVFVVDNVANLDAQHNAGILS